MSHETFTGLYMAAAFIGWIAWLVWPQPDEKPM